MLIYNYNNQCEIIHKYGDNDKISKLNVIEF